MKQAYKKRSPRATANSPPGLSDMGEIYFINLVNLRRKREWHTPYYARKNITQTKIQTSKTHFPCFLNANTCANQKNIVALHCQLEIKTLAQGPES